MSLNIWRNPADFTLVTSNKDYDFYVRRKKIGGYWYVEAWVKGSNLCHTMAGATTKRSAIEAAHAWAGWMHS